MLRSWFTLNKLHHLLPGLAIAATITSANAQNKSSNNEGLSNFSADSLAKHIAVLASDEFEGRKPFTKAEIKTIDYLRDQFKRLKLEPGNGTSYFQDVPMVNIATTASPEMQVSSPK